MITELTEEDRVIAVLTGAGVRTLASALPLVDDHKLATINAIADPAARCESLHKSVMDMLPHDPETPDGCLVSIGIKIACARHIDEQEAARAEP